MKRKWTLIGVAALVLFIITAVAVFADEMKEKDIQVQYLQGGKVQIMVRNNLWFTDLKVTMTTPGGILKLTVPAAGAFNNNGRWSRWTDPLPRPVRIMAEGEGKVWTKTVN